MLDLRWIRQRAPPCCCTVLHTNENYKAMPFRAKLFMPLNANSEVNYNPRGEVLRTGKIPVAAVLRVSAKRCWQV